MKQYHKLIKHVLDNGVWKSNRTGIDTLDCFGYQMRFNMLEGFPLLTTKKIHTKSMIHELIWLISGNTNIKYLKDNKVRIWDEWADENGDLGPVYGKQWRDWEKVEVPQFADQQYNETTIDQLAWVIDRIKESPYCRRQIVTAWNPGDLPEMALAPCHCFFQFNCRPRPITARLESYMINTNSEAPCGLSEAELGEWLTSQGEPEYYLDLQLYQRSADSLLGIPFNIASYALLLHMIAQITNTIAGDFIWTGGSVHIYENHMEQVKLQLTRDFRPLPTLKLNPNIKNIDDFKYEDIEFLNYNPHPPIKATVAV